MSFSIEDLNRFTQPEFVDAIGWVFEHSPWVAERACSRRPFGSLDELCGAMNAEVAGASAEERLTLLRAHPDLGTRAKISPSSTSEQAGAGLDQLTPDEFSRLSQRNGAYREKFGFPFLYAVKGSGKAEILAALELRLASSPQSEFEQALQQVYRIARFRLESIIS